MDDLDHLLAAAIDDYKTTALPQITVPGTQAAYATAAHRKHVRTALAGIAVLAVLAIPTAIYATSGGTGRAAAPLAQSGSPSPTPSALPSTPPASSEPSISPSTTASTASVAPLTKNEVGDATLTMPGNSANCPTGSQKLHNGQFPASAGVAYAAGDPTRGVLSVTPVDFEGPTIADAVVVFGCGGGDPSSQEAVGVRRVGSGPITVMGLVQNAGDNVTGATAGSDGTVSLIVSHIKDSTEGYITQIPQVRTYAWNGTKFTQVGGSTSFTTSTSGITATESDLVFDAVSGGKRQATFTVTLHNAGTHTVSNASVIFQSDRGVNVTPTCPVGATAAKAMGSIAPYVDQCPVASIAPGATKSVTFHFTADATDLDPTVPDSTTKLDYWMVLQVLVGDQALATQPSGGAIVVH